MEKVISKWDSSQTWIKEVCILMISGLILFVLLCWVIADLKSQKSSTSSTTTTTTKVTPTSITKIISTTTVTQMKRQEVNVQGGTYKQNLYQNLISPYCESSLCNSFNSLCKSICSSKSTQMAFVEGGEVQIAIIEGSLDKLSWWDIILLLITWPVGIVFIKFVNSLAEKLHDAVNKE